MAATSPLLKRAIAATKAFYTSQAATGTASVETEAWRDTCDSLYHQLTEDEQKEIRKLERRLKKKGLLPNPSA